MYIVNTIATVAVEYRSRNTTAKFCAIRSTKHEVNTVEVTVREREHHAKLDETRDMYTVNNKSDIHEPQLREFIELCPYANVCTPSSRM